jgi:hypothetical protein
LNLAIVCVLFFITFASQHISQCSIITTGIIYFNVVFLINFLYFTDKIRTLGNLFDYFLIFLTPVSHYSSFYLTTAKQRRITVWFVLIKICKSWNSLTSSKFWGFNNFLFWNVKGYKKLGRIRLWNFISMIFYNSIRIFDIFLMFIHAKMFISSLPHELSSNIVIFPAFLYKLRIFWPFLFILKRKKFIDPIS